MARMMRARKATTLPAATPEAVEVAKVAYGLYELRGGAHGHDLEDWLQAEQVVRARSNGRTMRA